MRFKTIILLIFIALIVVFSLQNSEVTDVKFLFWDLKMSRVLVILGSFSIGVIIGLLISLKPKSIKKLSEKQLDKQL